MDEEDKKVILGTPPNSKHRGNPKLLNVALWLKYNDIVASGVENASVVHFHCPDCERGMHLKDPMVCLGYPERERGAFLLSRMRT